VVTEWSVTAAAVITAVLQIGDSSSLYNNNNNNYYYYYYYYHHQATHVEVVLFVPIEEKLPARDDPEHLLPLLHNESSDRDTSQALTLQLGLTSVL